jgi:hypothetical protein
MMTSRRRRTVTADAEFSRCIAAREAHLEDLRIARAPLRSLTRAEMRRTVARLRPWQGNWKAKFMAFFSLKPSASCLKKAVLVSGLLLTSAPGHADPGSEGPFLGLSGHWSGAGTVTMTNGVTERIRCKATYAVNATGKAVQQTLRCASDSYRVEISSNVISEGGSLSGSWAEATRGVSGNISGRASGAEIVANVAGAGFTARLDVRIQGERQSVTIRPQGGTDVTAVAIALRK